MSLRIFIDAAGGGLGSLMIGRERGAPIRVPLSSKPWEALGNISTALDAAGASQSDRRQVAAQMAAYANQSDVENRYLELLGQSSRQSHDISDLQRQYNRGAFIQQWGPVEPIETDEQRWAREARAEVDALTTCLDTPFTVPAETWQERWLVPVLRWLVKVLS